jgi:methionyl-tRNA formyltransferase
LDTGPILLQQEVAISPDDNEGTLEIRLAEIGSRLLLDTIEGVVSGTVLPKPQDDSLASYARSVKKADCEIDWRQDAATIVNQVRGCTPRPGAYFSKQGSPLKVIACREVPVEDACDSIYGRVLSVSPEGIVVRAGRGAVLLTEVQPENKRPMHAIEYARGYRISVGVNLISNP